MNKAIGTPRGSRYEIACVLLLCFIAGLRIFVFSAAFPFFSDVDEDLHFDLLVKYSEGRWPRQFDLLSEKSIDWIVPFASPEFVQTPANFGTTKFPPPLWKQNPNEAAPVMDVTRAAWRTEVNFESAQPPLYYFIGACWWWMGRQLFGLSGISSLYWLRFLNVPLIMCLVWLGYRVARNIDTERIDVRIGVPLLLAFIPQDVFYSINNDILSPLCFGVLFLLLLQWLRSEATTLLAVFSGLAVAATYLTKLSNLPFLVVAIFFIALQLAGLFRRQAGQALVTVATLIFSSLIPIAGWMLWTKVHFGDLTGSTTKISLLGWTKKPFSQWWHHPIFTPHGLVVFWSDLLATFWRGEMKWQNIPLHSPMVDRFYSVSSLLLLCAAMCGLRRRAGLSPFEYRVISLAGLSFMAAIAFLIFLSIQFDFGDCVNPSRLHPYFTSGRLLSGLLIPFALLYTYSLVVSLRRFSPGIRLLVLIAVVAFATTSEILINSVVFKSEHNWFHRSDKA